jgi:hypothetical protein
VNGGWSRGRRVMLEWAILGGALVLLHAALLAAWLLVDPKPGRPQAPIFWLMGLYIVALGILLVVFFRRLGLADTPRECREARESGRLATATVLGIDKTGWHTDRSRNFKLQLRTRRYEYRIRLRLARPDGSLYEACADEYLRGDEVPKEGVEIEVRVHPTRPDVVVVVRPGGVLL